MKRIYYFLLSLTLLVGFIPQIAQAQYLNSFDRDKLYDLYQAQKYAEAVAYLEAQPMEAQPGLLTFKQKAYANMMAGNLIQAEKEYLKVLELQENVATLNTLAQINARRGHDKQSEIYLKRILELDSNHVNAYVQLADLSLKDTTGMQLYYLSKANQLQSHHADIAYSYAQVLKQAQRLEEAYKVLNTALQADSGNYILLQAKLKLTNPLKLYQETIEVGNQILMDTEDSDIRKAIGVAHFNLKQYDQAIQQFELAEKGGDNSEINYYYLSICYRNIAQYKLATDYATKTIRASISPNISSYYLMSGGIYELNKQYTLAESAYKKGLSYKILPDMYFRLGVLYDSYLGQKTKALQQFKLYTQQKPDEQTDKSQIEFAKSRIQALQAPVKSKK